MKSYSKPRIFTLNVTAEKVLMTGSQPYTGYPEPVTPSMGTDGETSAGEGTPTMGMDSKRFWNL